MKQMVVVVVLVATGAQLVDQAADAGEGVRVGADAHGALLPLVQIGALRARTQAALGCCVAAWGTVTHSLCSSRLAWGPSPCDDDVARLAADGARRHACVLHRLHTAHEVEHRVRGLLPPAAAGAPPLGAPRGATISGCSAPGISRLDSEADRLAAREHAQVSQIESNLARGDGSAMARRCAQLQG